MKRRGFLQSLAAIPLLGFLKPAAAEPTLDDELAAWERAGVEDFASTECEYVTSCGPCSGFYTIHHPDGRIEAHEFQFTDPTWTYTV